MEKGTEDYHAAHNTNPKPFVWTKDEDLIRRKVQKFCERLTPKKLEADF